MTIAPMAPWLSVLIPVYNVRDYLAECVASVLEQSTRRRQCGSLVAGRLLHRRIIRDH